MPTMKKDTKIKLNPILRWAGSKRQIAHRLMTYWNHSYKRYVEPFSGSAVLFFAINPPKALLSDLNKELIEAYSVLRKNPKRLHDDVDSIPRDKTSYVQLRSTETKHLNKHKRAVRFVYLNRLCFNGIFRTNRNGHFNVPYGYSGEGMIPSSEHFCRCAERLKNAEIHAWDFGETLKRVKKDDFVYLDPPYAVEDRKVFCEYGPKTFNKKDLARLAKHLIRIDRKGASFLMSYADCKEAREIFKHWKQKRIKVRRNIAGFSSYRRHAYELLITNIDSSNKGGYL